MLHHRIKVISLQEGNFICGIVKPAEAGESRSRQRANDGYRSLLWVGFGMLVKGETQWLHDSLFRQSAVVSLNAGAVGRAEVLAHWAVSNL